MSAPRDRNDYSVDWGEANEPVPAAEIGTSVVDSPILKSRPESIANAPPEAATLDNPLLLRMLADAARKNASDLLLVSDSPPKIYAGGRWVNLGEDVLVPNDITGLLSSMLTEAHRSRLNTQRDLDLGIAAPELGRYRLNIHYQRGTLAAAFRSIPQHAPALDRLGLPPQVAKVADFPNGLVLVTGCTGQGKSTTLAGIVDHMNHRRSAHVITIEDPIEFDFEHGSCLIEQRQIGDDTPSFASALKHVLRQRPDIILIGEMRDLETISAALTASETGHLVLASLHTSSASHTLARIIDVFPPVQQPQVRTQLAGSLRAILCQVLVPDQLNDALTPATELLFATDGICRAIRDNETHLIYSMLETGRRFGMHTLEQSLAALVEAGRTPPDDAFCAAMNADRLAKLLGCTVPESARGLRYLQDEQPACASGTAERQDVPWADSDSG